MVDVRVEHASLLDAAARRGGRQILFGEDPDVGETRVLSDRPNLSPLYRGGLWLAVIIVAGMSREPDAKYSRSVEARPTSTTPTPCEFTPSTNAAAMSGEDGRASRPRATRGAPDHRAKAEPMRRATSSFSSSGTTPRTS
jgi:hypothetical protein